MSYIFNNQITYKDSPNLDAFGRLRVSQNTNLLDIKHTYDKNPLLVDEYISGGTSVYSKEFARVRMSASTDGDFVIRKSKTCPVYQPGKSQLFEASFSNLKPESGIIKRVGCFTSDTTAPFDTNLDGFFLEYDANQTEPHFKIVRSGTTIYDIPWANWKASEYPVSSIDWDKSQLMVVDYQWLGVGRMRFGMVFDGVLYYFAEHTSTGIEDDVYMSSPNQPIRYEIRGGLGSPPDYFDMICSAVSTEGPLINGLSQTTSISNENLITLGSSGTTYPFIGFRLKSDYKTVNVNVDSINVMNGSNDDFFVKLQFNPGISSTASWTSIANTPFEYSVYTGQSVTSTTFTLASFLGQNGTSVVSNLKLDENQVKIGTNIDGTRDEMWVTIEPLGANAKFRGNVNVKYYL